MFRPRPMQRIRLYCVRDDAPRAALVLAQAGALHPESESALAAELTEAPGHEYQQLHQSACARLDKILAYLGRRAADFPSCEPRVVSLGELSRVNDALGELWRQCSRVQEQQRRLQEEQQSVELLSATLDEYADLDIDLSLLQGRARFLDLRVGSIPVVGREHLERALGLAGYFLSVFRRVGAEAHAVVAGPRDGDPAQVDALLATAGWRPLPLPAEFRDRPERLRSELAARGLAVSSQRDALENEAAQRYLECGEQLSEAVQVLRLAASYAELSESVAGRGGLAVVQGWAPADRVPALREALGGQLAHPHRLEARDPQPEEGGQVPTALRHPRWLGPFLALVKNYGVPGYRELDPTWLFALSYIAMFGMMFGDVGHGLVIILAALGLRRRLRGFAPFAVSIGAASTLFGFLYSSIFGYEHVLPALWLSPLSDPERMLTLGLVWGAGFILLGCGLYVSNRLAEGNREAAFLDSKGVAGVLFYLALLYAGYGFLTGAGLSWFHGLTLLLPLALILGYRWRESAFPPGERVLVVFIEGFETVMSYVTNTLSFLRVAAFALNHVALAVAVFTLAEMMDAPGHWLTVVLGNLFILVLEGGIVAIQVLRLEYYEGFSRFFGGEGREFRPLTLK